MLKTCANCGNEFTCTSNKKYCSTECKSKSDRAIFKEKYKKDTEFRNKVKKASQKQYMKKIGLL
jgi:DNA-directed RNA polymerase subunit RPC12/RpoP